MHRSASHVTTHGSTSLSSKRSSYHQLLSTTSSYLPARFLLLYAPPTTRRPQSAAATTAMPGTYVLTITRRTIGSSSSPPNRSPSSPSYQPSRTGGGMLLNTRELDQRASRACNYARMAVDGVDVPATAASHRLRRRCVVLLLA